MERPSMLPGGIKEHGEFVAAMNAMEAALGLPKNWCFTLQTEDDWSFVIKLSALCEAAINHLIETAVRDKRVTAFVTPMNMGGQFGKITFVRKLDLLKEPQLRFLETIQRVRNACAHDVRNVHFTFEKHYAEMDGAKRNEFIQGLFAGTGISRRELEVVGLHLGQNLKIMAFFIGITFILHVYEKKAMAERTSKLLKGLGGLSLGLAQRRRRRRRTERDATK